jgi:hypothetical protein
MKWAPIWSDILGNGEGQCCDEAWGGEDTSEASPLSQALGTAELGPHRAFGLTSSGQPWPTALNQQRSAADAR